MAVQLEDIMKLGNVNSDYTRGYLDGKKAGVQKTEQAIEEALHKERNAMQAKMTSIEAEWAKKCHTLATVLQEFVSKHEAGLLPDRFVYDKAIKILKDGK